MFGIETLSIPLWTNAAIFLAAAAVVWAAGTTLVHLVDAISDKTGMAQAFAGMLLLGAITSTPEIAATTTAAGNGNAALATNNLLGSLAFNIAILVFADALVRRHALTSVVAGPSTLLQGTLGIVAMGILLIAFNVDGGWTIAGAGPWTFGILVFAFFSFWMVSQYDRRAPWRTDRSVDPDEFARLYGTPAGGTSRLEHWRLPRLIVATAGLAVVVFLSGMVLSVTADALAVQTGLGSGLTGLVLLGLATSLPEISTVTEAVRLRRFELAIGEVLGSNVFNLSILFAADLAFAGPSITSVAGGFETAAAAIPLVMTAILIIGLLEQRNRYFLRLGIDSWAILAVYFGGLALLYSLSPPAGPGPS